MHPSLTAKKFKRRFGVEKKTFEQMLEAFKQQIPEQPKAGRPWEERKRRPDFS